jgi:hypothetical protein
MSDDQKPQGAPGEGSAPESKPQPDYVAKGEFNRKIDMLQTSMEQMKAMLTPKPVPKVEPTEDLANAWYNDQEKAAEIIVNRATKKAVDTITTKATAAQREQKILNEVYTEYPEVLSDEHDLTKRAKELISGYSEEERMNPLTAKAAVTQAASELGIRPKSRREKLESSNDSFSLGGGNSAPRKAKDTVSAETMEFARLMGLDTTNPKVVERLKARGNR